MVTIKREKSIEDSFIIFALLALSCMNFLGHGAIVMLLFVGVCFAKIRFRIRANQMMIVYAALAFGIIIASLFFYSMDELLKAVNYFATYVVGYNCFYAAKNKILFSKRLMFSIFLGFFTYILLIYIYNFQNLAEIQLTTQRILCNVWTGTVISVTIVGLLMSVVIGYSFYVFFCVKSFLKKVLAGIVLFISLSLAFYTATRTPFVLLVVVYIIMGLIKTQDQRAHKKLQWVLVVVVGLLLLYIAYTMNLFSIKSKIASSFIFARFHQRTKTNRVVIAVAYFNRMLDHIWGGGYAERTLHIKAHNFLQEAYDSYGILVLLPMVAIAVNALKHMNAIVRRRNKNGLEYLLLAVQIAMGIQICTEPVNSGYPMLLWCFFMVDGVMTAYLQWSANAQECEKTQ